MGRIALSLALLFMGVWLAGAGGCREESPAMKKANLGRAFAERGDYPRAIGTLQEAIRMDPDLVMSYELLGQAYEATGNYPKAIEMYRETVRRDPVRDTAYTSLGCLLLATSGAGEETERNLAKALEINQTDNRALACMGAVHLDRRDFEAAIRESEQAVSLNPQNVQGHLNLGIAYGETGDTARAREEMQRAINYSQGNPAVVNQARVFLQGLEHPDVEGMPKDGSHGDDAPGSGGGET